MITEPNYNKINLKGGLNTIPAPPSNLSQTIASITSLIKEKVPPHNLNFNPAYLTAVLSKLSENNVNNIANIIAAITSNNSKKNEPLIEALIAVSSSSSNNEKNNSNHNLTIDTAVANIISLLETTKHYNNSSNNNIIQENTSNNKTIFEKINFLFSKFFRTSIFLFFYLIIFKIVDQILIFFSFNNTSNKIYLYWISFLLFLFALLPVKRSYLESSL